MLTADFHSDVKRLGFKADHSLLSGAEVKKKM
jgi:hypothetical protein